MRAVCAAIQLSREEIFLARYDRLLKWAVQIVSPHRELAEDILHEAFVQFTLSGPDLLGIRDADNYLYGVLRNVHFSHQRRATRLEQLSHVEHNLVEEGMMAADPLHRLQAQDELQMVCRYACLRKETSISGSVLLLRFFHGYFPSEVAKLLRSSRNMVNVRLKSTRSEVRALLANRASFALTDAYPAFHPVAGDDVRSATNIFAELRREIFAARRSECFQPEHLRRIYQTGEGSVSRAALSHLVSCARCLDEANKLLGLPPLRERHPIDALGMERETNRDESGGTKVTAQRRVRGAVLTRQAKPDGNAERERENLRLQTRAAAC